jgi:hypothetical protein
MAKIVRLSPEEPCCRNRNTFGVGGDRRRHDRFAGAEIVDGDRICHFRLIDRCEGVVIIGHLGAQHGGDLSRCPTL